MIDIQPVIFNKNMTVEERILYSYLLVERTDVQEMLKHNMISEEKCMKDGLFFTNHSNKELCELLGCSTNKLIRIKGKLEKRGLLKQERTLDNVNRYYTFNEHKKV